MARNSHLNSAALRSYRRNWVSYKSEHGERVKSVDDRRKKIRVKSPNKQQNYCNSESNNQTLKKRRNPRKKEKPAVLMQDFFLQLKRKCTVYYVILRPLSIAAQTTSCSGPSKFLLQRQNKTRFSTTKFAPVDLYPSSAHPAIRHSPSHPPSTTPRRV